MSQLSIEITETEKKKRIRTWCTYRKRGAHFNVGERIFAAFDAGGARWIVWRLHEWRSRRWRYVEFWWRTWSVARVRATFEIVFVHIPHWIENSILKFLNGCESLLSIRYFRSLLHLIFLSFVSGCFRSALLCRRELSPSIVFGNAFKCPSAHQSLFCIVAAVWSERIEKERKTSFISNCRIMFIDSNFDDKAKQATTIKKGEK